MSFITSFKNMDNKFAWSFLGFLMAILFGGVTLYLGFIKENKPDLNYVVTADSSVLDIKEQLGSLDVLYEGESLSKRNQDLRYITFKVINQGDSSILSSLYDTNFPIGFKIENGEMADDPVLLSASNNYLKEKLIAKTQSKKSVSFSNVILEPNEYFEIKILVLHEIGKAPAIKAFGKVATVDKIDVLRVFSEVNEQSFIEKTFGGGLWVNVIRIFVYGLIFLFGIIALFTIEERNSAKNERRRKEKLIQTFKDYDSDKITEKDEFFFDYYLSRSVSKLKTIKDILNDPSEIDEYDRKLFEELMSEGLIKVNNEKYVVDESRLVVLTNFINYLNRKGEFKDK